MAWRLDKSVVSGWIDNRTKGRVTGAIRLVGRSDPVRLDLEGDANPDVAGCRLEFTNPNPAAGESVNLAALQQGLSGDITASRKVRVLDVSVEEACRLGKEGLPIPEHRGNALYVEWFSVHNGRVVIESVDFEVKSDEPVWRMTPEEAVEKRRSVQEAMGSWMDRLSETEGGESESYDPEDDQPMDEFEWEAFLRESDRRTEKYGQLLDRYQDHPDRDRIVAREMGWSWIEEAQDAEEKGVYEDVEDDLFDEDMVDPEPDPLTEGRDWVRDEHGRPVHPLSVLAREIGVGLWRECKEAGLLKDDEPSILNDVIFNTHCVGAKLSGALHALPYSDRIDAGFVIAYLKRSLPYLNQALDAERKVREKKLLPEPRIDKLRADLFVLRDGIIALMKRFRSES